MRRIFKKVALSVLSLMLALGMVATAPIVTAKAAEKNETKAEIATNQALKEGLGSYFDIFSGMFDSDFLMDLVQVDWSKLFNSDYDWESVFNGDLSFDELQQTEEWDAIIDNLFDVIGEVDLNDLQSQYLGSFVEDKYYTVFLETLLEKIEKSLKGDYNEYYEILNGDYTALQEFFQNVDINKEIDRLLANGNINCDFLNGDYSIIKDIIGGDFSYITGLLSGDYSWIEDVIAEENVNLEALFDAINKSDLDELTEEYIGEDGKVLEFVTKYYDDIVALCNGDYTFAEKIENGDYSGMLELVKDVLDLVGVEYNGDIEGIMAQLLSLKDSKIENIVRTIVVMLYDVLPEKYQKIMTGLKDLNDKLDEIGDTIDTIITVLGDLDADDMISLTDVVIVQKNLANLFELTDEQLKSADVDGDGKLTMSDVTLMQKCVAKLVTF